MNAKIIRLPVRDHHVAGQRPDWALDRAYRRGFEAGHARGLKEAAESAFTRGFVCAMAVYALGSVALLLAFHALGASL